MTARTWPLIAMALALVGGCSSTPPAAGTGAPSALPLLAQRDVLWLERVGYGLDSEQVAQFRRLGRERFLEAQLGPAGRPLPPSLAAQLDALQIAHADPRQLLAEVAAARQAINALPEGSEREEARRRLNEQGNRLGYEAQRRLLLRALYGPDPLREQLVWFWLNHFSVHLYKGDLRWLVGDYEQRAIRTHALGHFSDLVLATLMHPAMLEYLDNRQNSRGHVNENYARELLELHTLGVGGGYTQQDVEQLALILTGVGINSGEAPRLKPEWQALYRRDGAFEFNPARHDFGPHQLLGSQVAGSGFAEVENAVRQIVRTPACARFISRQLAEYFVADDPPQDLVAEMARTFARTDGDIAAVLRTMLLSAQLEPALGGKFKDPMRFVISSVRLAYDGRTIASTRPLLNWLNGLGEAPYNHPTPDGYPLVEAGWASPGQMSRRFEIARAIGTGSAGLFDPEDGSPAVATGFPQLSSRLYFEAIEPYLRPATRAGLDRAATQQEWNTFLLSSPDFSFE